MRKLWIPVKKTIISGICLLASFVLRRSGKVLAFGSWCGQLYIDNSKYLFEEALKLLDDSYILVWIGEESLRKEMPEDPRIRLLKKNSFASLYWLLRSKYMFCSQYPVEDFSNYNVYRGAIITYLHHGMPIKRWGQDGVGYTDPATNVFKKAYLKLLAFNCPFDYFVVSSKTHGDHYQTSLPYVGFSPEKLLCTGTPRNDMLVNSSEEEAQLFKQHYAKLLGFDPEKKVVLYLPTFRRSGAKVESVFYREDRSETEKMRRILEKHNAILIDKAHFADGSSFVGDHITQCEEYIHLTKKVNVQEMLLFTDVMISDYSGAFVDFLLLDRPIIHYIFDYEFYRDVDSGLYYDVDEFACGAAVCQFDQLLDSLDTALSGDDGFADRRENRRRFFAGYEKGEASKRILEQVLRR